MPINFRKSRLLQAASGEQVQIVLTDDAKRFINGFVDWNTKYADEKNQWEQGRSYAVDALIEIMLANPDVFPYADAAQAAYDKRYSK